MYGPWAFGTSAYSRLSEWPRGGIIGIHGTNRKILQLAKLLPVGTPLIIR